MGDKKAQSEGQTMGTGQVAKADTFIAGTGQTFIFPSQQLTGSHTARYDAVFFSVAHFIA